MLLPRFWKGSGRNPQIACAPDRRSHWCIYSFSLFFCDTVVRSELGGLKSAILSITFFSHFQNCDTVVLDSHQNFLIFSTFPELRYCGAGMIPDFLLLVSLGPWAAWAAWRAGAAWAASAAWVAWAA